MGNPTRIAELARELADELEAEGSGLTFEDVQKMSREEINERWADVSKVLEAGPTQEEDDDDPDE
jgi:hypothetical protein